MSGHVAAEVGLPIDGLIDLTQHNHVCFKTICSSDKTIKRHQNRQGHRGMNIIYKPNGENIWREHIHLPGEMKEPAKFKLRLIHLM